MRHQVKNRKLGTDQDHKRSLLRNLAMQVIIYEKIKTTEAKARAVQPFIEKLIGFVKTKSKVEAIREIQRLLQHENSSKKILEELAERYKNRQSGFTKVLKLGNRAGDNAKLVQISLIK